MISPSRGNACGVAVVFLAALSLSVAMGQGRTGQSSEEQQALEQAEAAFNATRYDEAAALYEKVTAVHPAPPQPRVKRPPILYRKKQYNEAVKLLRTAQQTLPGDLGIKAQLGLALYRAGAPDLGAAMLEEVVAQRPDMSEAQAQLALHYVKLGDGKRAVAAVE